MTPEEITNLFATAATTFQPISGQPNDNDLPALHEVLYPLLLDIPYDEDGAHNLISIIEPTISYTATWGMAFPILPRPPAYPAIADNASAFVQAQHEAEHTILKRDYDAAKFIRNSVDEIWYRDLRHARSFYTNVTAKQLLEHLDANCGGLHPSKLVHLPNDMLGYYTMAEGIPEYIDMLKEAQRKLACANLLQSLLPTTSREQRKNGKLFHQPIKRGWHGRPAIARPTLHASDNYWQPDDRATV